jgi:hypothetical protein
MFIQFARYDNEANSRIYKFDVFDPPRKAREFSVEVESPASRSASLKLQDGPSICFDRLRHELERETPEQCAEPRLHIGEQDIRDYMARHHPREKGSRHRADGALTSHAS